MRVTDLFRKNPPFPENFFHAQRADNGTQMTLESFQQHGSDFLLTLAKKNFRSPHEEILFLLNHDLSDAVDADRYTLPGFDFLAFWSDGEHLEGNMLDFSDAGNCKRPAASDGSLGPAPQASRDHDSFVRPDCEYLTHVFSK